MPLPLNILPLLASLPLLLLLLAPAAAAPARAPAPAPAPAPRDVSSAGPSGNITLLSRWRDAVGTATQVWSSGPSAANDVRHTDRSGPLSAVYRSALGTATTPCEPRRDEKCEVAVGGFATVGEVHYAFQSARRNIEGRSTQVMIACQCVHTECGQAVLIRPVRHPDAATCLYEQVSGDGFADCHTELLRVSYRGTTRPPAYSHGNNSFVYTVRDPKYNDQWTARGQRGWSRECPAADLDKLPVFDASALRGADIRDGGAPPPAGDPACSTTTQDVRYVRPESPDDGRQCAALYDIAAAAAAHRATQQDEIAIANDETAYFYPKPELVSDTELALSCSGAALGLLFAWSVFRRQLFKRNATLWYTMWVAVVQILSFVLEALPLHTALGSEIGASRWITLFASVDGTVALEQGHRTAQGSARGSVLILTAVLGEVRYRTTRVLLIAVLTAFFDIAVLIVIVLTLFRKLNVRRLQKQGLLPQRTVKDPEFCTRLRAAYHAQGRGLRRLRGRIRHARTAELALDEVDVVLDEAELYSNEFSASQRAGVLALQRRAGALGGARDDDYPLMTDLVPLDDVARPTKNCLGRARRHAPVRCCIEQDGDGEMSDRPSAIAADVRGIGDGADCEIDDEGVRPQASHTDPRLSTISLDTNPRDNAKPEAVD